MINQVVLMGRLVRNPELKQTSGGKSVCNFTLAVNNGYGERQETDFINCIAWNKTAEFVCKYFSKGSMLIADGKIQTRSWEAQDGTKRYATEVLAREVHFGESKREADNREKRPADDGGFMPLYSTPDDLP